MGSDTDKQFPSDAHCLARCLLSASQIEICEKERHDAPGDAMSLAEVAIAKGFIKEADIAAMESVLKERRGEAPSPQPVQKREPEIHDYFIQDRLGCGPLGTVYLASQLSVRRLVAIKALCPAIFQNEDARTDLFNHVRSVSSLGHKNLLRILDCVRTQENTFIISEYLRGKPLDVIVRREGRLHEKRALGIAIEITMALDRMRQAGLCHRNIKPSNIILAEDGQTRLTDYVTEDVAPKPGRASMSHASALFMAPEQISPRLLADTRSDLYSLGIVLYYMVTATAPFSGTIREILSQKISQEIRSPRAIVSNLSEGTCKVIWGLIQTEPKDRYQEPAQVLDDLRQASDALGLDLPSEEEHIFDITQAQFHVPLISENPTVLSTPGADLGAMSAQTTTAAPLPSPAKNLLTYPCRLRVISGSDAGLIKVIMPDEELTIGRIAGPNLLGVRDPLVSRRHCIVRHTGEALILIDNDSTNGTFLDGERITERAMLRDGSRIQVGDTVIIVEA